MADVIVTGGSGFIGAALTKALERQGQRVLALSSGDGDIASPDIWKRGNWGEISHVFHLAGRTYVPDSWANPHEFYRINVLGTASVLEFCRAKGIPLTYVSAYIYGPPKRLPIAEDEPVNPSNPYAHSKYLAEELCRFYSRTYGQSIVIVRPFNVYGEGQAEHFLIPSIVSQALNRNEIVVKDLAPKRDYVYLADLVAALIATMKLKDNYSIFNIGSGYSYSVKEVIDIVQDCADTHKLIVCTQDVRLNEIPDVRADISNARETLGWRDTVSFEAGIERIIRWERSK